MNEGNEEDTFSFIYPKRLVLIKQKWCDFCNKDNECFITELVHLFGYQYCIKCKDICEKQINVFCKYKKEYSTNKFIRKFDLSRANFNVKRSNGNIENNWHIDYTQFIKLRGNKYIIPMCSLGMFKYVDLVSLCDHNKKILEYNVIQKHFSEYFN